PGRGAEIMRIILRARSPWPQFAGCHWPLSRVIDETRCTAFPKSRVIHGAARRAHRPAAASTSIAATLRDRAIRRPPQARNTSGWIQGA
ncbi:hypothetical protein L7Q78_36450, partial [Achromobacter xylosoxidans]|nr:hypothetical protein [Achromobacter xylosoxidans]